MTKIELLDYELAASRWWVGYIGNEWLQNLVGHYFAWKVKRKRAAYRHMLTIRTLIETQDKWRK